MPLQQYVRQLRPRSETYIPHVDRVQSLFESFTISIDDNKEIDDFDTDFPKADLKKLLKHLKSLNLGDIAFAGSDAGDGKIKIRNSLAKKDEVKDWISKNTPSLIKIEFGQGTPKSDKDAALKPRGAD